MAFSLPWFRTLAIAAIVAAAAAPARADEPSPAALDSARTIIVGSGMKRSFDLVIPQMFDELERNVLATRPELKEPLQETLKGLLPEFVKTEGPMIDGAALALAKLMSEQELKDTAAFFTSPSGKKYVDSEPKAYEQIVVVVNEWRRRLSVDVLARVREEMKKKNKDF